MGDRNFTLPE